MSTEQEYAAHYQYEQQISREGHIEIGTRILKINDTTTIGQIKKWFGDGRFRVTISEIEKPQH